MSPSVPSRTTKVGLQGLVLIAVILGMVPIVPAANAASHAPPAPCPAFDEDDTPTDLKDGFDWVEYYLRCNAGVEDIGSFPGLVVSVLAILLSLVAIVALGAIIWGGVMYITSLGNEDKTRSAKRIILFAVVGLVVVIFSALIINLLLSIF